MLSLSQVIVLSIFLLASTVSGQTLSDSLLSVRAVDVGSDNCSIVELPYDDGILILDAGHWRGSRDSARSIDADILIAPHHGSDSSSSVCFIKSVSPGYVVFQSGHRYGPPSRSVKDRYLQHGVPIENIFRTDLKDTESNPHDWDDERYSGCKDLPGDDDIAITIITNQGIS